MHPSPRLRCLLFALALAVALISPTGAGAAPKYKVLHAFTSGGGIGGSLTLGAKGNLYGTTGGTVFELTPEAGGKWHLTTLHKFSIYGNGGEGLMDTNGLLLDSAGNLYGTTQAGGGSYTYGTVFELTRGPGRWKENVIHRFGLHDPARGPWAGVAMDKAGNLYGTAGAAYELTPSSQGWREIVLHDFNCENGDGCDPYAGLIMDALGNLYGTTQHGGSSQNCDGGCGTVYQLAPGSDGNWSETILHSFSAYNDGAFPGLGALYLDGSGNLYGTTTSGTIFELKPGSDGWRFVVLYTITGGSNGTEPDAGLVMDQAGNLYGTTIDGGEIDCGVVFKLAPGSKGKWIYTVLHSFTGNDGCSPAANLILDSKGNLYGTTALGGTGGYGVAFELTP